MANDRTKGGYVAQVRDNTRRYIEELLRENVRLRASVEQLGREEEQLRRQLDELRADLDRRESQHNRMLDLLGAAEAENRRFEDRYVEVEHHNSNLAALYAASYQLHSTVRRAEVLLAIQEIVINLIGSEELVIASVADTGFAPLASVGVEVHQLRALRRDAGVVGRAIASGSPVIAEQADDAGVTVAIPLILDGRLLAVIVIFRLLPQKPRLDRFDRELCELLGTHAATALYCAELHDARGEAA